MLANDDGGSVELNLDLCLGEAHTNSKCVSTQCKRSREHDKELRTHRLADGCIKITTGFEDGREMTKIGDNTTGSQIKLAFDKHPTELFQTSCRAVCMRETDDQSEFPQGFSNTSRKVELPFAKYVPQDSSSSTLRKSFSDVARHLSNAHAADAQYRKDVIHRQHVLDRQRKKELQAQKRQAARKKRKILIDEQKYQKMQLQKSKPFPCSPTHTQKSLGYGQRERSFEGSLERTSSEKSVASQRDKIHEKQSILQEERARFQDMRRAVQIERGRSAMTDKETTFGSKLKAGGDERNLKAGYSSDHKSSQLTAKHNKSETAQWIRKFHELHKLTNASLSTTQKKIPVSEMASNYSPLDASQIEFKNADQVDVLLKKEEIPMNKTKKATSASDKDLESEDPKPPNDQIVSARKESSDSATTSLKAEPPAPSSFSRRLPTNADSFIQAPFAFSLQNVGGFSYPVPYFVLAGATPFTSYSFSIPPHSTPLRRMATLESTASSRTPVLQPTPVRHPRISTAKPSNSSGRSRKQEPNCSQGEATLLPNETQARRVPPKPPLSGAISSDYSKGKSFLDHAHSHTFSGPSTGSQEGAASGPSHSRMSSSSSCQMYQSAHGETVESYPIRNAAIMNVEAIQTHAQQTVSETKASAAHRGWSSTYGPLVSTTANGKSVKGVLHTYDKGEVRICCECHGNYMNAREFIIHAGGVAGPHPERNISVINPFLFSIPTITSSAMLVRVTT